MIEAGSLLFRDLPDLEIIKDLASCSYSVAQILMLVCAVIRKREISCILEELLAQPLPGDLQITGLVPVGTFAGRQDVLICPVGLADRRVEGLKDDVLRAATKD